MTATNWWNRLRYRSYAPVYDWVARPLERGRKQAIDRLDLEPGANVLIPGCGTGLDLEYLPAGVSVTAIDVTPSMVRRTERRAEQFDGAVDARVGDAQALPVDDDSFDAVLLHLVLSVVPDPAAVIAETARVVRPDGQVSLYDKFVPERAEPSLYRRALNPVAKLLFADLNTRLEELLADSSLAVESREPVLGQLYHVAIARPRPG